MRTVKAEPEPNTFDLFLLEWFLKNSGRYFPPDKPEKPEGGFMSKLFRWFDELFCKHIEVFRTDIRTGRVYTACIACGKETPGVIMDPTHDARKFYKGADLQ